MVTSTLTVTVSKERKPFKEQLEKLAEKLGCRMSDLVWSAVLTLLAHPPKAAPVGSSKATGKSPGFWIAHEREGKSKRVDAVAIFEVRRRSEKAGRTFFRYKPDDAKSRARALRQAKRAAEYDADLAGIKEVVKVTELKS